MLVKYNNNNVGRKAHTNTGETMKTDKNKWYYNKEREDVGLFYEKQLFARRQITQYERAKHQRAISTSAGNFLADKIAQEKIENR